MACKKFLLPHGKLIWRTVRKFDTHAPLSEGVPACTERLFELASLYAAEWERPSAFLGTLFARNVRLHQ